MERNEESIDLSRLFQIMVIQWKTVAGIVLIFTMLAFIVSLLLPKGYESTALVQTRSMANRLDTSSIGASMAASALGIDSLGSTPTLNYVELMKSRTVLDPIIDSLDYDKEDRPDADKFAKDNLDIQNTKGTNLISVTAKGKTPEEAQRIAQTIVDNFLLMQTDMNQQTQSLLVKFLDARIVDTKNELEQAEKKLADFSREHKIYSPEDQVKFAIEQMSVLDQSIGDMEVQAKSAQAQLDVADAKISDQKLKSKAYQASDNENVQNIRSQIVAKRLELVGLEERYTEQHPSVQKAKNEIKQLQIDLEREVSATVDSNVVTLNPVYAELLKSEALAAAKYAVAIASEKALEEQRQKKESEMSAFPDDVLEYTRLTREVQMKNGVYLDLVKRYEQNKIQEAMDSMDIQVIDAANLPDEDRPARPKKLLITAFGLVLGIFVSMGYGMLLYRRGV
nr:GumC family protein [uncultured Selenomonas sp.]